MIKYCVSHCMVGDLPRGSKNAFQSSTQTIQIPFTAFNMLIHNTHNNNNGNELADQLAKEAACDCELYITYNKYPKSAVISELKELGLQKLQSEWDSSNRGALTGTFFPKVKDRLAKKQQMSLNLSTVITGHGKLRAYLHRFKIIEDPMCPCEMNPQTTDHVIRECTLLSKQTQILQRSIITAGGRWPISKTELANKYMNLFQKFVNSINFKTL